MLLCPMKSCLIDVLFCLKMWHLQATLTTAPGTCRTTSTPRSTLTTTPTSPSSPPSSRSSPWAPATTTTPPPRLTSEDFRVASERGRKGWTLWRPVAIYIFQLCEAAAAVLGSATWSEEVPIMFPNTTFGSSQNWSLILFIILVILILVINY